MCALHSQLSFPFLGRTHSFPSLDNWRRCIVQLPVPFQARLPLHFPPRASEGKTRIPNIVHFIFGYKWDNSPFTFTNFMAVASALAVLRPEVVMLHCQQEPTGFFWELLRPHVRIVQGRDVTEVFGNPVDHYAHKADVVRMEALLQHGGIYLDVDVLTLRPLGSLMDVEAAMGQEGEDGRVGLCNAVILSAPNSTFLRLWYDQYRTFNQSEWNYHSVQLPGKLAKSHPELISQLPYNTFHWPFWDEDGMRLMFGSFEYKYTSNKAVHVWNHGVLRSRFKNFSMTWCFECHSTLVSMMRAYVPDPLFSVIMPCYNQSQYIEEALRSVAEQRFPSWEIIVVDDKSPDGCAAAAQAFGDEIGMTQGEVRRLTVLTAEQNRGLAESRNVGIRAARGIWICALDADDRIGPDYFAQAAQVMSQRADLELIYSNQEFFGDSDWVWEVPEFETGTVTVTGPLPVMSLYTRRVWAKAGGYSSSLPWGNEDYDFWLKVLEVGVKYHKLEGNHVFYRFKQKSMMRDGVAFSKEEHAMLRTRHVTVYHTAKLLRDHHLVMGMTEESRKRLLRLQEKATVCDEDKAYGRFWLALSDMHHGRLEAAMAGFRAVQHVETLRWQPALYLALCVCRLQGRAASAPLLTELVRKHPQLNRTQEFQRHDANCRASVGWPAPVPRRDIG